MNRCTATLTATGLLWTVAITLQPDAGSTPGQRYEHIAAHLSREGLAGLMFLGVAGLLVLSAMSIGTVRVLGRGGRTIGVGGVLVGLSSLWLAATYAAFNMLAVQLVQVGVPVSDGRSMIDGSAEPWQHWFDLALLCVLLGPVVLAAGLRRARLASWLPLVLWVVGILTYAGTEFVLKPGQDAAMLVCTVALFLMGRGLDAAPAAGPSHVGEPVAAVSG